MSELQPHKIMTPEEYAALKIIGWHCVCKDVDGCGGVGISFSDENIPGSWQPIEEPPSKYDLTQVELFHGRMEEWNPDCTIFRDVRRSLGFWDGLRFRDLDTGHDCFKDRDPKYQPTHWRRSPPAPSQEPENRRALAESGS